MATASPAANDAAAAPEVVVEGGVSAVAEITDNDEEQVATFPPYPPYAPPAPPSVADAVIAGHGLRRQHKVVLKKSVRPLPKPAKPKFPKATDVKMSRQAMWAHACCLRRHGAILTDRLEYISKPRRRNIICFWRENADTLPADTIARLRSMLDADEPFKPDQAYAYFVNLKKTKKKQVALERARVRALKEDINSLCSGKKFIWARNAAVAFARGVQQRLSKPGRYVLTDGMLRLSDIILSDICGFMKMRKIPTRRCLGSKANFMMEVSDKVAVWIDEILTESDDRMLMMDFDEDDDVALEVRGGGLFGDDGDGGPGGGVGGVRPGGKGLRSKRGENPAYLKLDGNQRQAFDIITQEMDKKGDENLVTHGNFEQSYKQAAEELKRTTDFKVTEYNAKLGGGIKTNLKDLTKDKTPQELAPAMRDMIEICANVLAQNAENNKVKGPLFKLLIQEMKKQPNGKLFEMGKIKRTNAQAAKELESAKALHDTDHPDLTLSKQIFENLKKLVIASTPENKKKEMDELLEYCSKYLSQKALDESERGPAFELLIKELEAQGHRPFCDYPPIASSHAVAHVLKTAPGLKNVVPETAYAKDFDVKLHRVVDQVTPPQMQSDMKNTIDICSNYLSAYMRDRGPALQLLLDTLKKNPKYVVVEREGFSMDYLTGATETENAPALVPFLPIKDIAADAKEILNKEMENVTPPELKHAMHALINDVANHLSQIVAIRSGAAGDRYKMGFLAAINTAMGSRPLYNYKSYSKTYADSADEVLAAESKNPKDLPKEAANFAEEINSELNRGIPTKLAPTVVSDMGSSMDLAAKHLAKSGVEKGEAMDYVVNLMKEKGEKPLANLQGYDQTYADGARRLEQTPTLRTEYIDNRAAATVKEKLTEMTKEKPDERHEKVLPEIINDAANFLAKPKAETHAEKKQVLADLVAREGDKVLAGSGAYKMTYEGAGDDIKNAPVGVKTATNEEKRKDIVKQIGDVMPNQNMKMFLKETTDEGAAHVADAVEGRGQALEIIEKGLKQEGNKEFINVGKFKRDHTKIADLLVNAPDLKSENPSPVILTNVEHKLGLVPKEVPKDKPLAQEHMKSMTDIAAKFIATTATKESGLDAKQLAELDAQGFNAEAKAAAEAHRLKAIAATTGKEYDATGPHGETEEQRRQRYAALDAERIAAEEKSEANRLKAIAATTGKEYDATGPPGETEEQRRQRYAALDAERIAEEKRLKEIAATTGKEYGATSPPGETQEQRRQRYAALDAERIAAEEKKRLEEEKRLVKAAGAEGVRRATGKYQGGALGADYDPEHTAALGILHDKLRAKGQEVLHEQPPTVLTHETASEWLNNPDPEEVLSSVKNSPDTARLHKKLEKKYNKLVEDSTPDELHDAMQDVVIEAGRKGAEHFVAKNWKNVVNDGLVAEMQKRGDEVLVNVDGASETLFFAAQRLKRKDSSAKPVPDYRVAGDITKKLDDTIHNRPMPRKVNESMKEHVKESSKYLSAVVTKPDEYIETYVALLDQLDDADDLPLIEGDVPKTCKESADYLRQLTTFKDTIGLPNPQLKSAIQQKLKNMMYNAPAGAKKPNPAVLDTVIADCAALLVSSVRLQAERTGALNALIKEMDEAGEGPLLRHGVLRKTFKEAADELKGKTTGELDVPNADPVVSRKIQLKLTNLMQDNTPPKFQKLMPGVIDDATKYLAVRLLEPRVVKVCKCFKNVFVQCELWCDEILRRVARPCCTCSRHMSVDALKDLVPGDFMKVNEDQTGVMAPGVKISLKPCPNQARTRGPNAKPYCPAHHPTTTSYLLHSTTHKKFAYCDPIQPAQSSTKFDFDSLQPSPSTSDSPLSPSPHYVSRQLSPLKSLLIELHDDKTQFIRRQKEELQSYEAKHENRLLEEMSQTSYSSATSSYNYRTKTPTTKPNREPAQQFLKPISDTCSIAPSNYSSRTPIITSEHEAIDWDSTMVNLLWNVMAWRDWIQEIVDHALAYQYSPSFSRGDTAVSWVSFYTRVTTEALQWRQYNVFSRQLATSLHLRYRNKEIASPVRSNVKTKTYIECQEAMLDMIDMFNRWTQWLTLVVKETDSLQLTPGSEIPLYVMRWNHLKTKVDGYSKDWENYLKFLKIYWERKYRAVIADYLPSLEKRGPVWVMSAGGAVPSGAVSAGLYDNEVIWVARALHRGTMLPATLLPSKHCCLVYAEGQVHSYPKYQVMCNAEVHWVAWRGGSVHERAVSVAPGTHVGRVHYHGDHLLGTVHEPNYHCCVVIFGRPFAFYCYELLMLASDGNE